MFLHFTFEQIKKEGMSNKQTTAVCIVVFGQCLQVAERHVIGRNPGR